MCSHSVQLCSCAAKSTGNGRLTMAVGFMTVQQCNLDRRRRRGEGGGGSKCCVHNIMISSCPDKCKPGRHMMFSTLQSVLSGDLHLADGPLHCLHGSLRNLWLCHWSQDVHQEQLGCPGTLLCGRPLCLHSSGCLTCHILQLLWCIVVESGLP